MAVVEKDPVTVVIQDAISKHQIKINPDDSNIIELVAYALHVGYADGWKDAKQRYYFKTNG